MKNPLLLLVYPLLLFTGCSTIFSTLEISPPVRTSFNHRSIPETNKTLDIARYDKIQGDGSDRPFVYYTWAKQREEQLEIVQPEISNIDKVLRVWGTFSYHPRRQRGFLAEFTYDGSTWSGRFYDYLIHYDEWKYYEKIENPRSFALVPQAGWDQFEQILQKTRFVDLPTDEKVPGLREWVRQKKISTSATYSVEYGTPSLYRFFIFQNPQETQAHFDQASNFMLFHDYLFEMVRNSDRLESSADQSTDR